MDVELWRPYLQTICQRHQLLPYDSIRSGLAGTFPTFIVNERWVIKLFGYLFGGEKSFLVEGQANKLIATESAIPAPRLLGTGSLFENSTHWSWPYLLFPFVPGISIGEAYTKVNEDDLIGLSRDLGVILRGLHLHRLEPIPPLSNTWQPYQTFLQHQFDTCYSRHCDWGTLPSHLLTQLDDYLLPPSQLVDEEMEPYLIHADMTADHVLGRLEGSRWTTLALIDFGDAMVANLSYELVALHLNLFRRNKTLLRTFLDSYGLSEAQRKRLPHITMSMTLLHNFNVLEGFFFTDSSAHTITSLEELATLLWNPDVSS